MEIEHNVVYALQTGLERAIDRYKVALDTNKALKTKDTHAWQRFLQTERGKIRVAADLQTKLDKYREDIKQLSDRERSQQKHDSSRLGDHMRGAGMPRPGAFWDAHAIISGNHAEAWALRVAMAECELGVDDAYNGCWLPRSTKYCGHRPYPKAVPHSRIHRYNYYAWLNIRFAGINGNIKAMIHRLTITRNNLLYQSFPPEVMLPKGKWNEHYDNIPPA